MQRCLCALAARTLFFFSWLAFLGFSFCCAKKKNYLGEVFVCGIHLPPMTWQKRAKQDYCWHSPSCNVQAICHSQSLKAFTNLKNKLIPRSYWCLFVIRCYWSSAPQIIPLEEPRLLALVDQKWRPELLFSSLSFEESGPVWLLQKFTKLYSLCALAVQSTTSKPKIKPTENATWDDSSIIRGATPTQDTVLECCQISRFSFRRYDMIQISPSALSERNAKISAGLRLERTLATANSLWEPSKDVFCLKYWVYKSV